MHRRIFTPVVILSAILIFSCATDRMQIVRKDAVACKNPDLRYEYGRKKMPGKQKLKGFKDHGIRYYGTSESRHSRASSGRITGFGKNKGISGDDLRSVSINNRLLITQLNPQIFNRPVFIPGDYEWMKELQPFPAGIRNNSVIDAPDLKLSPGVTMTERPSAKPVPSVQQSGKQIHQGKIPFHKRESSILLMALLAGVIPFVVLKSNPKLAAEISFLAAMNPWKTRLIFAGLDTGLMVSGLLLGAKMADSGIHFSHISRYLLMGVFLTSTLLYPVRSASSKLLRRTYMKQKSFDLALAVSGFMLMVNAGNDPSVRSDIQRLAGFRDNELQYGVNAQTEGQKHFLLFQTDKQQQNDQTASDQDKSEHTRKVIGTILISLLAVVLTFLLAAGACGLACNDMTGLAYLVGIGGGGLLIWLTILAIRRLWRPNPRVKVTI
jgi:hypothetical protein